MSISEAKRQYGQRLVQYIEEYSKALIVGCDNVGSRQMQNIRIALRGQATVIMGKNTTVRKVIKDYLAKNPEHPIESIVEHMVGNVGLIFSNNDLAKIRDIINDNKVPAPARVGATAPCDVFIEPGPTGCDPGQTSWFQALNIPTKINRGQIEMISRVHLLKVGDRVGDSQASLLQRLGIRPFSYGMTVQKIYENGNVFDASVLDIDEEVILDKFRSGVSVLAALSLEIGYPTKASVVHSINNAYKAVLAISLLTDYKIEQVKAFEEALANPQAFAAPVAAAGGAAEAAAAPESESEEEEEFGGAGGLFGDDDEW